MWTEKLSNGKYRYCERYIEPLTGKTKKISVVLDRDTAAYRKQASEILKHRIDSSISSTAAYVKNELTLSELVELYRSYQFNTVERSTYKRNYHATETIMSILGPDVLISNLSAGYVKAKFAEHDDKPGTINERYKRFKAMMRWAYENDYVSDIRYLDKIKPLTDKEKKLKLQEKYLEASELKMVIDSMTVPYWKYLTEFLSLSGLRCGEAIALTMDDVDLKNDVIHVTKTYDYINELVTSPKTECSNREVYIQPELKAVCQKIRKYTLANKMRCGYISNLFMCDRNGDFLSYAAYNKYLKETSLRAIGYAATTHVMRHTHVSLLAEAGVPLETITRRVGHVNSKITKDVYLHVTNKQKEKDKQAIQMVKIL